MIRSFIYANDVIDNSPFDLEPKGFLYLFFLEYTGFKRRLFIIYYYRMMKM